MILRTLSYTLFLTLFQGYLVNAFNWACYHYPLMLAWDAYEAAFQTLIWVPLGFEPFI